MAQAERQVAQTEYLAALASDEERKEARDSAGWESYTDWRTPADKAVAAYREAAEMGLWAEQHGSARLRRSIAEEIECEAVYRDERLVLERPGWSWAKRVRGDYEQPRNPTEEAFAQLDAARKTDPDACLVRWEIEREREERYDEDGDDRGKYEWAGWACVADFLGREIVTFGGTTGAPAC